MIDLVVAFKCQLQSRVLCTLFTLRMARSVIAIFFLFPKYQQMKKRQEVF